MKKLLIAGLIHLSLLASAQTNKQCDPEKESKYKSLSKPNKAGGYGDIITKDNATTLAAVEADMNKAKVTEKKNIKITGKVSGVCKVKGCWMEVDNGKGQNVRIRFKDYEFFVPRDCEGQTVYAQGIARFDTTSVAMLRHYAEDAGKSKKEIEAINSPEVSLTFEAAGVLFDKK